MNPLDATRVTGASRDERSRLDDGEPSDWHDAIACDPDLLVARTRPIVADLLGPGRIGLGTLFGPADPLLIIDGSCYRLDAGMSAFRVSPLERVRRATVVDVRGASRFRLDHPIPRADIAHLAVDRLDARPQIVAVVISGTFSGVTAPNGAFGRSDGTAVGFITGTAPELEWHLSFLTADRTFGGPVVEISIETAELKVLAPRVLHQASGQS